MYNKSVEFLPNYKVLELAQENYDHVYNLARFIIDSITIKAALLKLPNNCEINNARLDLSTSKIENLYFDHISSNTKENFIVVDFGICSESQKDNDDLQLIHPKFIVIVPLQDAFGVCEGILCIYDDEPKKLDNKQICALNSLADQTVSLIAFHRKWAKLEFEKTFVDNKKIALGNYLETNGTGLWKLNLSTGYLSWSANFLEILGYHIDELKIEILADWRDLVYHLDQEKFINKFKYWCDNNLLEEELECRMVRKSGDIIFLTIKISESKVNKKGRLIEIEGEVQDITTQKKVWEQIELINPKYTTVIQAGYNWLAIVDLHGTYTYVNKTLEMALGFSSDELIGQNIFSFIHNLDSGKVIYHFSKFVKNEPFVSKPFRFRHKNGSWKWIEILLINLNDDPMIQGIVVNARDITERVLLNQEIKTSEEKHRLLFNTSPYPKYILELHSLRIVDVNDAMVEFYRFSREELLDMSAKDLRPREEIDKFMKGLEEFQLQTGTFKSGIYTHKKKNGKLVRMEVVGQHLEIDEIKCVLVTCSDVTDREEYLNDLKLSEHKLKSATAIAKLGYWSIDSNDFSFFCSEEVYKIWERNPKTFNFSFESFIGTIHPDDRDLFAQEKNKAITQKKEFDFIYRILLPDNSIKWVKHLGRPTWQMDDKHIKFEGTVQDITQQQKEEHQLRLLESVVTNTTDVVLVTEAEPFDELGPRIIYVNEAFTKMTGYSAEEVMGKTPSILRGPKSDESELKRLRHHMRRGEPCEITTVNYKKNGEEFWVNFSINPVCNEKGYITHWISIERDVSDEKNQERQKNLLIDINVLFGHEKEMEPCLNNVLNYLVDFSEFALGEIWLVNSENSNLNLIADYSVKNDGNHVRNKAKLDQSTEIGHTLVNSVWEKQVVQILDQKDLKKIKDDYPIELEKVIGIPLIHNAKFLGVLVIGLDIKSNVQIFQSELFQQVANHLAAEIRRKLIEIELELIFNSAPDILCKAGNDGYFKKINAATTNLLGYSEDELLSNKILEFIHPEDREKTINQHLILNSGKHFNHFENRYVSKNGEIVWLSWTANLSKEEDVIYAVAKDITENKQLKSLLNDVTDLALIGGWELNFGQSMIYWSDMTKKIHEVGRDYSPSIESILGFYKNEETRNKMVSFIENATIKGESWDIELPILTAEGNEKWVRIIGKPEFVNGDCVRIFGSFQDINDLKTSQLQMEKANNEKNNILESIGDAFISVDNEWTVTYWNSIAENLLMVEKDHIIGKNMWKVLEKSIEPKDLLNHYKPIRSGKTVYFQDYFSTLNKWLEISAYPSENNLSLYIRDITENRQSQIAIEKQNAKLREIAWTQSHVVRAPLARLLGIVELFHENLVKENEKIELLDHVHSSAMELDTIIQDIAQKSQSVISTQKDVL